MVNKLSDEQECPIDVYLYNFINTHLHIYYRLGMTPNMVTTLSILFGFIAAYQIMHNQFVYAAISLIISYYLDCVDGKLARKYDMITKFGDLYDHFGDFLKILIIMYSLFKTSKNLTITKVICFNIILLLGILQCVHMGYQECVYNKSCESPFLNIIGKVVAIDKNPKNTIQYTKYFGCGMWYLCFALLIIFWGK